MTTYLLAADDKGITGFVNAIDSYPKALVAIAVIAAIAWITVTFLRRLF